ncbi:hypothetical protein MKW92_003358 [Papaver armeniacum]|nr:hypothetical protein MKW92_003358 [Papaver armeniacum]
MASFFGLRTADSFLPLVVGLILAYHHAVMLVEGGRSIASRLSMEEDLELDRQLNILNKPPIKSMHTRWGDIFDCVEFHKQPAFDHPLLKNHVVSKKVETTHSSPHKKSMSQIEGCPKGTVPIRRTTKEDLIRAKKISSSSNGPGDEYRAGISLEIQGKKLSGASGVTNIWHPYVNHPGQFSGAEMVLQAGTTGQTNEIKVGWIVNPLLYGDAMTRSFAYWTGGNNTGCYNNLCPGFVQLHSTYTPVMAFENTSIVSGTQIKMASYIHLEPENGNWWLTLGTDEPSTEIGYWPGELFPLLKQGAEHIYWGGRVKAGNDAIAPEMASAFYPNDDNDHTGSYENLKYYDKDEEFWMADHKAQPQSVIDCKTYYSTIWDDSKSILRYGGPGGGKCY